MRSERSVLMRALAVSLLALGTMRAQAQSSNTTSRVTASVTAELGEATPGPPHKKRPVFSPAVLWLKPLGGAHDAGFPPHDGYVLLQKNKMFSPHLLVVPVGSSVTFPNHDPFFHNVFSLFNGKRFDLGLYEAGKSKNVTFSREGVSYIFCNIHPEMSAVVVSLTTPMYSVADAEGHFLIRNVVSGDYEAHLWVEGEPPATLDGWTRIVHLTQANENLGTISLPPVSVQKAHTNKFGQPYVSEPEHTY